MIIEKLFKVSSTDYLGNKKIKFTIKPHLTHTIDKIKKAMKKLTQICLWLLKKNHCLNYSISLIS